MQAAKTFSVTEGNIDGYRMVAMIHDGLQAYKAKSATPWFLGLSTSLSNPSSEGLPTATEADVLNRWEDVVELEIRSRCKAIFIGRVTWKGNRELLYYVDDPQQVVPKIEELIDSGTFAPFRVSIRARPGMVEC